MWFCLIWWMCVCAGGGFGMLVCLVWWMWVCADLSSYVCVCVCVFFFETVLVDVGLCRWWLSVLLRQ